MIIPVKTLQNGFALPVYGFGTWQMGGRLEHNHTNDDAADILAIQTAIDMGVTHFDTAEVYAAGYAEELLGRAIKKYNRSKLFITSKAKPINFKHDDLINSCKQSLQRVGTDYFDLYLLHHYSASIPLAETIGALDELVRQGLIRNIGVSNFTKEHLADTQNLTKNKIVCDQVHLSLEFREPEVTGLLKYCQNNDVFLVAWRPTGKGKLAKDAPPIVQEMCKRYQKTPTQIAINWLISQDHVVTLSKTTNIAHLKENLGAIGWEMAIEDIELLQKEYPNQKDVSDTVKLG